MVNTVKNFFDMLSNIQQMRFITSFKRTIQKKVEATGDLIGNEIAGKITKVSENSQQNTSETVTNENNKEIPKERCTSPKKGNKWLMILDYYDSIIMKYKKKTGKQLVMWLVIKLLTNYGRFKKFTTKPFRNSYKLNMVRKYLKEDTEERQKIIDDLKITFLKTRLSRIPESVKASSSL